jgi:hypothetical protein
MRADGQTDMTKLVVAFCNFANALKMTENYVEGKRRGLTRGINMRGV